ncbi:MerR family DNA-binding transcriptional regulator [Paenibacillus lycopersici]|uniref:MerR family DNA-binding transcriptional regulator n=1 Tax=Paenibacillus lycopersici TaxID=2704462 RepID=A0A6C0FRR6_9BACL|nr:MerR family transcriptional regulator [Paenibacillus lycopersici]QHT58772.1 MerR family DNA-binding transcriptional regulator [Paenibacillus lycopersici]
MLSIADFAACTGLNPSALRFYESKGLLVPAERLDNGYRRYAASQISQAKMINSLRQSGIGLHEIGRFLHADEASRAVLLKQWRRDTEARMLSVQIAASYLNGIHPSIGSLHLARWEEPVSVLWQPFLLDKPVRSYSEALEQASAGLRACKVQPQGASVIRVAESLRHAIRLEVGFPVKSAGHPQLPPGSWIEVIPPTLFVTVDCAWDDMHVCMRTIRYLARFGFEPSGRRLERHFPQLPTYELMIPVSQSRFPLDLQAT